MTAPLLIPMFGVSPLSMYGGDDFVPIEGVSRMADKLDPATGELLSLRLGSHPVDAGVQFNWRAKFGSGPALGENGQRFTEIRKVDQRTASALINESRRVMRRFESRGLVDKLAHEASTSGSSASVEMTYTNTMTEREDGAQRGV